MRNKTDCGGVCKDMSLHQTHHVHLRGRASDVTSVTQINLSEYDQSKNISASELLWEGYLVALCRVSSLLHGYTVPAEKLNSFSKVVFCSGGRDSNN